MENGEIYVNSDAETFMHLTRHTQNDRLQQIQDSRWTNPECFLGKLDQHIAYTMACMHISSDFSLNTSNLTCDLPLP